MEYYRYKVKRNGEDYSVTVKLKPADGWRLKKFKKTFGENPTNGSICPTDSPQFYRIVGSLYYSISIGVIAAESTEEATNILVEEFKYDELIKIRPNNPYY